MVSGAVAPPVAVEEARDPAERVGQVVGVRQEDDAEMVRRDPVEAGALHDQDLFLGQQFIGKLLVVGNRVHPDRASGTCTAPLLA
jgi:hypothetical protein